MIAILFTLLSISPALAAEKVAEVTVSRGNPTFSRGEDAGKPVRKGFWLLEGDSLLTGEHAVAKLRLKDGTLLTLGHSSKVTLKSTKGANVPWMLLVSGMLRARVAKAPASATEKLVVTTKTAAIGVRGTEFTVVYDEKTSLTSLITLDGIVSMALLAEEASLEIALAGATRVAAGRFLNLGGELIPGLAASDVTFATPEGAERRPYTGEVPAALLKKLHQSDEAFPPANPAPEPRSRKKLKK